MVVTPCSAKTLAAIRAGYSSDLIARAADVVLKEQRRLVLVVRETPLSTIHLENMVALSRMGVTMLPPMPACYNKPACVDDIVDHIVARVMDQFGLESDRAVRWEGPVNARAVRGLSSVLLISHRTVEWHLRNIFNKLGITSRLELRAMHL